METPQAARIASYVASGRPHILWAIPGDCPPADAGADLAVCGAFMVDVGCALVALNDPHLTGYTGARVPVVFACARKVDRQKILDRRGVFAALGYRLWPADGRAGGAP